MLTRNFDRSEFDVHEPVPAQYEANVQKLAVILQWMRDLVGAPGIINSCYRSPARNASIPGAASKSAHLTAAAADVTFLGVSDREIIEKAMAAVAAGTAPEFGLIMIYDADFHVHVGLVRPGQRHQFLRRTSAGDVPVSSPADVPLLPLKKKSPGSA